MKDIIKTIKLVWTIMKITKEEVKWHIKYKVPFFARKSDIRFIGGLDENGRYCYEGIVYDRKKNRDCYFANIYDFDEDDILIIIDFDYGFRDHLES